ncbi:hypothetical protein [Cytobacillus praedii]|uniref:Uncharacterized protein n=1 Tax=Cytobacillus praedii TaxID=1742358 RepID=A0A4R1AWN5_9BACI|nr:hypothetical protein [Cytobacillus praedii]TCJ01516.1 hypothetical protein E0Y62_23595 [Cytobacillus praedii]
MRILFYEVRKIIVSPIVLGLTFLFLCFNFYLIYENSYIKDDIRSLNQIAQTYGTEINDEMLSKMQSDYEASLKKVNAITSNAVSKTYKNMDAFYSDRSIYIPEKFSEKEIQIFNKTALLEYYYSNSLIIDESFLARDPVKKAEYELKVYGISGEAAELIRSKYNNFTERFNEVKDNREYKYLFPAQSVWETHLLLFKNMFKALLIESLFLTILVTAYVMNFEFERGTYLLAYSSKRGRKLWLNKFFAALITNVSILSILLAISLAVYFSVFSYREFWLVPISSSFNAGKEWFMSWWNLSFIEYLAVAVVLSYLLIILFTLITVVLARWIRNSYLVFFTFLCLFGAIFINQGMFENSSMLFLLGSFTPVHLILNSFVWFMQRTITFTAYYEIITILAWYVILLLAVFYSAKSFQKCDLK